MDDLCEMQALVHAYRDFSECVVEGVEWEDHSSTIAVTVDYVWTSAGTVRADEDERLWVTLRFRLVQEFEMKNELPALVVADPALLNWSHNEISRVVLTTDDRCKVYDQGLSNFIAQAFGAKQARG